VTLEPVEDLATRAGGRRAGGVGRAVCRRAVDDRMRAQWLGSGSRSG
jgi:hypothetical protein